MTKKKLGIILAAAVIVSACFIIFYNVAADKKGDNKSKTSESSDTKQDANMSTDEKHMYQYGVNVKDVIKNQDDDTNIIAQEKIEQYVESMIKSGDATNAEELKKNRTDEVINNQATYLAAKEAGYSISDEEIDNDIKISKEAMTGKDSEKLISAFCKGAGITEDEYWDSIKVVYKKNRIISLYNEACRNQVIEELKNTMDISSLDESELQSKINEKMNEIVKSNVEKFKVHVE